MKTRPLLQYVPCSRSRFENRSGKGCMAGLDWVCSSTQILCGRASNRPENLPPSPMTEAIKVREWSANSDVTAVELERLMGAPGKTQTILDLRQKHPKHGTGLEKPSLASKLRPST